MTASNISYSTNAVITIVLWLFGFNVRCNKHGGIVFREIWISANFLKRRIIANWFITFFFFQMSFCFQVSFFTFSSSNKKRKKKTEKKWPWRNDYAWLNYLLVSKGTAVLRTDQNFEIFVFLLLFFCPSFSFFSYLFAAVVDLLLDLLPVKEFPRKHH